MLSVISLRVLLSMPVLSVMVAQDHDRRGSPFEAIRWSDGNPEVRIEDTWYRPVSIHGVPVEDILEFCDRRWRGQRVKRFGEDLIEAMAGMGHSPPEAVDLVLVRLSDGKEHTMRSVEMSERNRNAIRDAGNVSTRPARPPVRSVLPRADAEADLDEFQRRLEDQFAYLNWKGVDLEAGIEEIRSDLQDAVLAEELAGRLSVLLLRFGDGHAGARAPQESRPDRYPPVLLVQADGGVAAIRGDRSALLDPRRPFVVRIDGRDIDEWIDDLRPWIVDGSPQLIRTRALRAMREINHWRALLQIPTTDSVQYELASKPSTRRGKEVSVPLDARRPIYGAWPRTSTRVLDDDIGYLRIPSMDDDEVPALRQAMKTFRDTKGLIVDVRGNGGGSRGLLLALGGYLLAPGQDPWVGNVAVYRVSDRFDDDHLEARFMRRAGDRRWSREQRQVIERFAARFEPEWDPGDGFSEWHYLLLDRTGDPLEYHYTGPVIVLCDADCFSATDIFLGALSGHPQVRLMGSASGGGSARSQQFVLPRSGIEVRCASMASFRPDGRTYDGRGIEVDVEVSPAPEDFLEGGTDRVLDRAVREILGR